MSKTMQHEDRVLARKHALQLMYQGEIMGEDPKALIEEHRTVPETQGLDEYALALLQGAKKYQDAIDERIVAASENWTMDRMPIVDRSLLRLAAYEMCYVRDVPVSVSINEAVNLAKEFGGEDSPRFVNGILGRIATQIADEKAERRAEQEAEGAQA